MFIEAAVAVAGAASVGNYVIPLAVRYGSRRPRGWGGLALTYDDGPGVELTPQVLDLLSAWRVRATFFALGRAAIDGEAVLDRAVVEGHEVGCHSHDHLHAWKTLPWRAPIDAAAGFTALGRWLPKRPLFRPPYGKMTLATWLAVRHHRGKVVWWTLASEDTYPALPDPRKIAERMVRERGGVVLMHDFDRSPDRAAYVLETTRLLLEAAQREGIRCGTISEILSGRGCVPQRA